LGMFLHGLHGRAVYTQRRLKREDGRARRGKLERMGNREDGKSRVVSQFVFLANLCPDRPLSN
jgi:hypothetical protein